MCLSPRRGRLASSLTFWDKTSYVLGVSATSKRADKEHGAFKALHREHLAGAQDAGLKALLGFLDAWTPQQFEAPHFNQDMLDANMVFRLDGEQTYLHERPPRRRCALGCWSATMAAARSRWRPA